MKMKYFSGLIVMVFLSCNSQKSSFSNEVPLISKEAKVRIDSTLERFFTEGKVAGISALIFEKGEEVYFGSFGFADREAQIPMDRNTIVQIYSMTKPVTGVALMQLYEQGKFALDDTLFTYLPEFSDQQVYTGIDEQGNLLLEPPKRPISIRDITRHTAGFANSTELEGIGHLLEKADPMNPENTLSEMAVKMGKIPLLFHPGERWYYGPSVDVQALLVERLSGLPFDQYLQENILNPLGMTTTRYVVPETDWDRMASSYRRIESGELVKIPDNEAHAYNTREWPMKRGGSGLTSTLDDYMKFAQMMLNNGSFNGQQIIKPQTIKLMTTNQLPENITDLSWLPSKGNVGFGIDFAVRESYPENDEEKYGVPGEFFWDGAASTLFWIDPANQLTAVLFVQIFPFDPVYLHKSFRAAVYGQ